MSRAIPRLMLHHGTRLRLSARASCCCWPHLGATMRVDVPGDTPERKGAHVKMLDRPARTSASKGRSRSVRPQQATTEDKKPQQKIEGHDRSLAELRGARANGIKNIDSISSLEPESKKRLKEVELPAPPAHVHRNSKYSRAPMVVFNLLQRRAYADAEKS
ncbi:hypothetical protein HPP92_006557 [Vanilla planifolia]|uniref:Uncharacterized protein n=1 Tax=Vanilla planifolia TaxID=51239 RepID=A0A835RKK5_VANPL|nr:hypothetical protein HPP92_006557 [Vanilla planifolia]